MIPLTKTDRGLVEVGPRWWIGQGMAGRKTKRCLTALCALMVNLTPACAVAQVTEPLLPVPPLPSGPQAPPPPGQPTYPSQTVRQRPRPELDPLGLRPGRSFRLARADLDHPSHSDGC